MKSYLSAINNFLVFIGIYLYFTAWVYIHFYYEQFGLSTEKIKIDYSSYLVYSWDVLVNSNFLLHSGILLAIAVVLKKLLYMLRSKLSTGFMGWAGRQRFICLVIMMIAIFPYLYYSARNAALQNYRLDREDAPHLKTIQFIFRKDAEYLSPAIALDSIPLLINQLASDIMLIKKDSNQQLKLLAESDDNYIVLNQRPYIDSMKMIPTGYVYFVNKQDVLLTKIILRSTK